VQGKGWFQEELSKKIETDTRQVSLYENNKVAPSAETVVRISRAFNVSIDFPLTDEMPRRPLSVNDESIFDNIQRLDLFTEDEKKSIFKIIDGLAAKNKLKNAVHDNIIYPEDNMQPIKQQAINAISSLPDTATVEDMMYRLYVIDKVNAGLEDMRNGKTISTEELLREIQMW